MAEALTRVASYALRLEGVGRRFGALVALEQASLEIQPGERRAIIGANGAGKTTLFNCVTGDFLPTSGRIVFFGEDITQLPTWERIRRGLRRTYQNSLLFRNLAVIDNLYLAARGICRGRLSLRRPAA
jgi:branched-chain amino acid transport system ATP-binding protein